MTHVDAEFLQRLEKAGDECAARVVDPARPGVGNDRHVRNRHRLDQQLDRGLLQRDELIRHRRRQPRHTYGGVRWVSSRLACVLAVSSDDASVKLDPFPCAGGSLAACQTIVTASVVCCACLLCPSSAKFARNCNRC